MKKLGIIGCGWLGSKIADYFFKSNWEIYTFNSSFSNSEKYKSLGYKAFQVDFSIDRSLDIDFKNFDVIVIALPMSRNKTIEELSLIFENIGLTIQNTYANVFLCSSTGIYPQKNGVFTENSFLDEDLDFKIYTLEKIIKKHYPKTNILRLAGLMGDNRIFSKYFTQQDSLESVNHIHYEDIINIIETITLNNMHSKTYNVVAPIHPSKKAIFEYQKNKLILETETPKSRIISSDLLIKELN